MSAHLLTRRTVLAGALASALTPARVGAAGTLTRHVDPTGDDGADGASPETAWRTLARLTEAPLPQGSLILLRRGGIWRETLRLASDGVVVTAYGEGAAPVVSGADPLTGLTPQTAADGTVHLTASMAHEPTQLFADGVRRRRVARPVDVGPGDWAFADGRLVVGIAPAAALPTVEVSVREFAVDLNDRAGITLEGLAVERAARHAVMADRLYQGAIRGCTVREAFATGINASSDAMRADVTFEANHITGCGLGGIGFGGRLDGYVIRHNRVERCCQLTEAIVGSALVPADQFATTGAIKNWGWSEEGWQHRFSIEDNHVADCGPVDWAGPAGRGHGIGIWVDEVIAPTARPSVAFNTVSGCTSRGIYVEKSDTVDVDHNLIVDCAHAEGVGALALQANKYGYDVKTQSPAMVPRSATGNRLRHNTVVGGTYALEAYALDEGCLLSDNLVADTIFVSSNGSGAVLYSRGGGANNGANGSGNRYVRNCVGPAAGFAWTWGRREYRTVAALEAASGGAVTGTLAVDPGFEDAAAGDFSLAATSPCRDAASEVARPRDLAGTPVPSGKAPDIGCYEYAAPTGTPASRS